MSDRLKLAFEQAARLPESEQDAFAEFLLAELQDEAEWNRQFAKSQDKLAQLAAKARAEHRTGRTKPLDELCK